MKKAIKIDVETKSIYHVEIGDYQSMYPAIGNGCTCFCVPMTCDNGDAMYCDDEACLQSEIKGGFTMVGFYEDSMLVGNAIILGTDSEGESVDALSTIEEIAEKVIFVDSHIANEYAKKVISTPPTIITW